MPSIVKTISTSIIKGCQIIKCSLFGENDVRNAKDSAPYGIDSCPIADSRMVFVDTSKIGRYYIVGCVTTQRKSVSGEIRIFSTTTTGTTKAEQWFRTDGTIEINGNVDNMVRYIPLNSGLQSQAAKINNNLSAILTNLTQVNVAINSLVPGSVTTPYVPITVDININNSKINEVKTSG